MMNTSRKLFAFFGGIAAVVTLAFLMGPTGGLPSRPVFQAVTLRQGNPIVEWDENDAGVNTRRWACRASGAQFVCGTRADDGSLLAANEFFQINRALDGTPTLSSTVIRGRADGVLIETTDAGSIDLAAAGSVSLSSGGANNISICKGASCLDQDVVGATNSTSAPSATGLPVGGMIRISKGADTSRASTTTLTADPDLQITNLPAGHYIVEYNLTFTLGAGFVRYRPAWTGYAQNVSIRACASGTADVQIVSTGTPGFCLTAGSTIFSASNATIKAFAGGTLSINWAQDASNAAATILESDSWLQVTRIN